MKYKIIELTYKAFFENYIDAGKKLQPCILFAEHQTPFAWICDQELCDMDYIRSNNIGHLRLNGCHGSTVVSTKGDLGISIFGPVDFVRECISRIQDLFFEKINGIKKIGNDLVYQGCKYGAITGTALSDDLHYAAVQISNNLDRSLISKICKKPVSKIPANLENPITSEDIFNIFNDGEKCDRSEYDSVKTA